MVRHNLLVPRQVRNRPRQLQHPMVRPRRQMQLLHRRLEQPFPRRIRLTKIPYFRRPHLRIAGHLRSTKTLQLSFSRLLHPPPNRRRILGIALIGQLLIIDTRHLNVDVNAIQQRTTDPFLVAHNRGGRAATFPDWVAKEAAGAGVRVAVAISPLHPCYTFAMFSGLRADGTWQEKILKVEWISGSAVYTQHAEKDADDLTTCLEGKVPRLHRTLAGHLLSKRLDLPRLHLLSCELVCCSRWVKTQISPQRF